MVFPYHSRRAKALFFQTVSREFNVFCDIICKTMHASVLQDALSTSLLASLFLLSDPRSYATVDTYYLSMDGHGSDTLGEGACDRLRPLQIGLLPPVDAHCSLMETLGI